MTKESYLRPVAHKQAGDSSPWYTSVAIGKNPLSKMLKNMCEEAGIPGNKTNHSLRAYAASKLFNAGVPEKVIQDRTGHRSLDGPRKYERISEQQKEAACKVLSLRPETTKLAQQEPCTSDCTATSVPSTSECGPISWHNTQAVYRSQQIPSFSFGSASLQGCTINIYQSPQLSSSETKDLFEGQW